MAGRTLRNNQGNEVFTPRGSECEWSQNQSEELNSATEIDETTQLSPVELEVEANSVVGTVDQVAPSTTEKEIISERSSADNTGELKNMLASGLDAIQESNKEVKAIKLCSIK
jgi:hypothetical protein